MSNSFVRVIVLAALVINCAVLPAAAQAVVKTGPPPEIRALVDGFMKAANSGSADAWEAFAREHFSPEHLQKRSEAERKQLFDRIRSDFGSIAFDRVTRRGPDAPLELTIKGSTGVMGVIVLELDASSPPRIANLTVDIGKKDADLGGVPPPPVNGRMTNDELSRALDGYFAKLAASDVFSGVVLVARNLAPVFYKPYGFADRANKIPNTAGTRFNVGSINKTFTHVAIAQLVREGKLAYSDTLEKFFPDYPQTVSRPATVEQLLTHRAGLADFFGPEFTRAAKDQFRSNADYFRFVGTLPPLFAPGARNQYCNGCYIALGAIIERVSGMSYERYVDDQIFRRAEMTSTGYPHTDSIEPGIALGYTRRGANGTLRSNVFMHGAAGSAAGGGYSTAMDLLSYVKAIRAERFPGADARMGIAGGAPGTSAVLEAGAEWAVIVLSNLDPPTGERIGVAIMDAIRR
jgi:CubicO group peptidase (beta-lactamase class C family)